MSTMLYDTVDASNARLTKDGYLVAEASVARIVSSTIFCHIRAGR